MNLCTNVLLSYCRPLQRMVVGMFIAGLAFMVAGFVQISVQKADTSLSSGDAKVRTCIYACRVM